VREAFTYTKFPSPQWWDSLAGRTVRVTDLQLWQGASVVWRGLFREGAYVPGTGFPVIVVRIARDDLYIQIPQEMSPPPGYGFHYDDPYRDIRIVAVFARCTHLCCHSGWHITYSPDNPPALNNYFDASPTKDVYGQIPIYCICHDAQFDPLVLRTDSREGVTYVAAAAVGGPTRLGLPVVPVRADNDVLFGGMPDPRWYAYC
jgi:Rieske Fe-S protein